ncbi:hypothetical protein [Limnohabitans sp. 2KL-3]|uniref:hypothetical protein n=1 Tax=Limnohabitans sp. 2KL-3 TaxID=1100700 RepID=UPI000AC3CD6C|nr:hypothetical protein [Limnohabitans sp. 2KL-3]
MTAISLSSNAEIQSWELNHQNADLTVNGVTLVGNEAAAYLFGMALSGIDLSAFGSLGQDRFYRTDAVLEFPPGSGQRVSLTEISDALRYKYSIDPLVEFSSNLGLAGYNLADVNSILSSLNAEFKGRFELALLNRTEDGAQTVFISQPTVAASLQDLLTDPGRKALVDLAKSLRATILSSTNLQQKLNPLLGIDLNEAVFPGASNGSTASLNQLLETFNQAIGGDLQTLMPDLFADGKLHLNDFNVLLAAAREAVPAEAVNLAELSLDLIRVTQGSQIFTGKQALAMLTAKTLATLDIEKRTGLSISEAPVIGLDDQVFTNPLISGQKLSLGQLIERMQQNTGYDPLAHLQPRPNQWTLEDVNALIDGINTALQPSTAVSLLSFNFVNADGLAITAQQAYAYNLLRALNSAGSSSALSGVWSTYANAANGTSSHYTGTTVNLSDLQTFNNAVTGNAAWTLPNAWTLSGSTRALTGESPLLSDGANSPTVFLTRAQALAVLSTLPNGSIVYAGDDNGDVCQIAKQLSGTITERNFGTSSALRETLANQWGFFTIPGYGPSDPDPGVRTGLNIRTSSPEVLKAGMAMLVGQATTSGYYNHLNPLTEFPYPAPAVQYGFFGLSFNPGFTPTSFNPPYQLTRGQNLDAQLFEYPSGAGQRLSLRELSAALAQDFRGSAAAGAHNGALSLEDWFMGYGSSYSGQDATGFPTGYGDVFAAAGEYFNANGGTAAGPQVVGVGTFSDPTKTTPVTEWSIKAAMLGLYWANPASSTDDYITPVVANNYQLGAVASAAKTASTLVGGVNTTYATITRTFNSYSTLTLDKLRANLATAADKPAYMDDLAELRRQIGSLSTHSSASLDMGSSRVEMVGSLEVATALQAGVLANSGLLARLSFDAPIGLDEPLWQDNQGQVQTLRELLASANILNQVLSALPRLSTNGLDFDGFNRLLATARRLNPEVPRQLEWVQPWFQPYVTANQSFQGGNAMLLRLADSLFAQVGQRTYQNKPLVSTERVFVDPTDASGQRQLSIDDISQLLSRLLGVNPLPRRDTWYAQDIEQAVKDLYAGVQPAIAAPGRASSAAITSAELVSFVNALVPANGATFGPDTFNASDALFSHTVNGVTRSRSLNELLQTFSAQSYKDLAPRLQALGILRDGETVQLRGLNALRTWVASAQPGQVTSAALPVTGTATAVDASVDYASVLAANQDEAWGLGALQRLMAEWALVPDADRGREWSRWQMRFQALLADLDDSVGGLAGLGLDSGTQAALRTLTTSDTAPEFFPQGAAIQSWLGTLQTRLAAALVTVKQDLRNLSLSINNPAYASVRNDMAQRLATLEQQVLELQQGSDIVSRLKSAGNTLGAFQAALAAEQNGQRPDVLAWLARFDIPASDLGSASFRTSTGGLDAFDLTAWINQASDAPFTSEESVATLAAAEADWQTTAATWNDWLGDLYSSRLPALRSSLTADLQLQQAYKAVDPNNAVWDQNITRIQAQLTRTQALLETIPALRTAMLASPDDLRTAMQSAQTRLGVTDILAELAYYDVPGADLTSPTHTLPPVTYFDADAFWAYERQGAAGSTGYPKQEIQLATQPNTTWLTATRPVLDWVEDAHTRMQGVLAQVNSAISRLTARWEEPATSNADRLSLASAIDAYRQFRIEQQTRMAVAERLLAAQNDAVALDTALTELQTSTGGPVLSALASYSFDPASISGTGKDVVSVAGVSCPDLTAAAAAVQPAYANDSVLSDAFSAWNTAMPNWRSWMTALTSRTAAVVSDLGVSLATLQLQRSQVGNTAAENQAIDQALWRIQTRLAQFTAVKDSVARLQELCHQPAAFNAAVPREVQELARYADDLPKGQTGISDLFNFLSYFDVDAMERMNRRTTVPVTVERFDLTSWLSAYPQGHTPRNTDDLATAFGNWDSRASYRSWLTEVSTQVNATRDILQADRGRLYQALAADGNDDAAVQTLINHVIADQQRLSPVFAALDRLRFAPDTAAGFAAAVTAAKTAAGLSPSTDLFDWLSGFNVPTDRLLKPDLRRGAAAIESFDLTAWQTSQAGAAAYTDSTIGTSNPASWVQALDSINTRAAVVEQALTQAQIRTGWTSTNAANTALAAAMAATPAIVSQSARASTLALAVAAADRLQQATTDVLRSPLVDAEGKLRSRSLEQGDDGRFYYDSQAVLVRVGRMLASLPIEHPIVSPSQAVFTDPMWGNRRLSLADIMSWCREAAGFDPLTLADPANQRASWTRAELNFLVDGINQQLRSDATQPVLTWQGTAAHVLVSSATPAAGQQAAQISQAEFQNLLHAQILGSDLSQTVVETELRDELVGVINLLGQMDSGDFALAASTGGNTDAIDTLLQELAAYDDVLTDPTRRTQALTALKDVVAVIDAPQGMAVVRNQLDSLLTRATTLLSKGNAASPNAAEADLALVDLAINSINTLSRAAESGATPLQTAIAKLNVSLNATSINGTTLFVTDVFSWLQRFDVPTDTSWSQWTTSTPPLAGANTSLNTEAAVHAMAINASPSNGIEATRQLLQRMLTAQGNSLGVSDWLDIILRQLTGTNVSNVSDAINGISPFLTHLQDLKTSALRLQGYYSEREAVYSRMANPSLSSAIPAGLSGISDPALATSVTSVANSLLSTYNAAGATLPNLSATLTTAAAGITPAVTVANIGQWAQAVFGTGSALSAALNRSEVQTWLTQLTTRTQGLQDFYTARAAEATARVQTYAAAAGAYDLDPSSTANNNRLTSLNTLVTALTSTIDGNNWVTQPSQNLATWLDTNAGVNTTRSQLREWCLAVLGSTSKFANAVPASGGSAVAQSAWQDALTEITALRDGLQLTLDAMVPAHLKSLDTLLKQPYFDSYSSGVNLDWTTIEATGLSVPLLRSWASALFGPSSALVTVIDQGNSEKPSFVTQTEWLDATRQLKELMDWMPSRGQLASAWTTAKASVTSAQAALREVQAGQAALQRLNTAAATSGAALATQWQTLSTAAVAGTLGQTLTGTTPAAYTGSLQEWLRRFDVPAASLTAQSVTQLSVKYNNYGNGTTPDSKDTTVTLNLTADALGQSRTSSFTGSPPGLSIYQVVQKAMVEAELNTSPYRFDFFDNNDWTAWQTAKTGAALGFTDAQVSARLTGGPSASIDWVRALQELQQLPAFVEMAAQSGVAQALAAAAGSATQQSARVSDGLTAINALLSAAQNGTNALAAKITELKNTYASQIGAGGDLFTWLRGFDVPADQLTSPVPNSVTLSTRVYSGDTDVTGTLRTETRHFNPNGAVLGGLPTGTGLTGALPGLSEYELGLSSLIDTLVNDTSDFFDGAQWTSWRANPTGARPGYTDAQVNTLISVGFSNDTANLIRTQANTLVGKMESLVALQSGTSSAALAVATQTVNVLGMPLSDPTRRAELLRSLNDLKLLLDNNTVDTNLSQVQRNLSLQQQLAVMNTQWGVTDVLSNLTSGRLTSANLGGLAEVRAYLTETKTTAENLRTFYDARLSEAGARKSAYEKVSPAYSFRASDATRNANVLANLERGLASMQTTYEASNAANSWPTYYMVAIFHNGSLHNTGNANTVHWDDVSSWANKLGIDTSNYLTKDLMTANNAPITQAQWKATMVALQQVIGSMRTSMGRYSGEKFDRLESIYAGLRDQGFVANFSQQVNSFGYSLSPSDPTASTTTNLRPSTQRIDAAELSTLAVGLFGTDSRIKVAIDAGSNCTQAQWQAALQEFNDLFVLLKTRNQLQAAWETEQALEHAAYHSREEITAGLSAMTSLITATNTSASAFQSALTSVGTAQQAWKKGQDVMTWLRSYDVDPTLLTYGSQSSLATSYAQYANNSALDPTMSTWTSASVNWGNASMGLGVPSTLPTGASAALDTANLAIKAAVEAELRGDYHFFDWTRWKLGSVDEADLAGMNRADTARLYTTLESTRISAERLEDHYTDRLNEAQDRVTAFQNMVPGYDFSEPAVNTGHLALLDALVTDMTTVSTAAPYTSNEFKYYVFSRVYYAQGAVVWGPNPQPTRAHPIDTGMFIDWSDKLFGADSQLSQMLRISWINPSKVQWDAALEQIEQLRGTLRAAVEANAAAPVDPNLPNPSDPFTAQADGIANLITDLEVAPASLRTLFDAAGSTARYGMSLSNLNNLSSKLIGSGYLSDYSLVGQAAHYVIGDSFGVRSSVIAQLRQIEAELRVPDQLASLQSTIMGLNDRLWPWSTPQNLASTVTDAQGNAQLLQMAIGLNGSNSKIKLAWNAGSAVTQSQWTDAVLEARDLLSHLKALAQLGTARTRALDDAATAQTALTEVSAARTAIGTLSTAAYAVTNATAGTAAETNALTALQAAFNAVTTPSGQDVMDWLRNFQVNASSLTYSDPNRLSITSHTKGSPGAARWELTSTSPASTAWVSWDDLLMGIPRGTRPNPYSLQPTFRSAQIAAIEAQVANRFTSFDWAAWKASVAAYTPTAGTALQGASTGYTNTTVQAAADRDLSTNGWSSLGTSLGTAIDAVEKLQAPDVLVVPNGVTDITLRNLDEPDDLAAYGGLVADVTRRDAVQSAVSSLVDSLQANADLSTDQQISRLSAQLGHLQDSLEVDDLLAELTQGVYSTDNLTGSLTGVTQYLNTLTTNATGLQTFMTLRQTEAQTRVDAYARTAGAYDTSMTVTNGVVVPSNDALGQALSQLYTALKTRVANVASSGIHLAEAIKTEAVYAAGQYGNEARKRDVPITPEMLRDWCVTKYGNNSSFKQLLDLGALSTNATLAQSALNEVKGVLFDGGYRTVTLANDPNTLRANQLDALANAMGNSGNLRTAVVLGTHGFDAATLSTWATNLFGPNSKVKAAYDANGTTSGTNWTDAVEEVRQLARDIRVTQLASNTAFIDQLQSTYNGLSALYTSYNWVTYTSAPDRDVGLNRSTDPQRFGDWTQTRDTGKTIYDFTENYRNFAGDWASLNTGSTAISSSTASMLSQWLSLPASAGLIKSALQGATDDGTVTYGNALKELNQLIVQIKQRSNLMPAVYSARQALADAQQPQAEVTQAISTLNALKTAAATGSGALVAAINAARATAAVTQYRGTADLFAWLRSFDVDPRLLWTNTLSAPLNWQEDHYTPSNYVVPVDGAYTGTWPNLAKYTRTAVTYLDWWSGGGQNGNPALWDYASEHNMSLQDVNNTFFNGWSSYSLISITGYRYSNPVNYAYTQTIPLTATTNNGQWTPDWSGTGLDGNSSASFTWGLLGHNGNQYIGVSPWRTRLASLYKAEANGQYDSFSWRQWKAGSAQTQSGSYVAAYAQAQTARTDPSVLLSSGMTTGDLLTIQGQLSGLLALLSQCRSLSDVIKAAQTDSGINLMGLLQQLGIVVDGQYASRDGLNKLLEVLRKEMPERITADTVDALAGATESTRSRTLAEFQAAVSVTQQRENALQKLQDHLDSWNNYTTLYERRTHWTQWLAELQTLATSSRAQVGELGLDVDALMATLRADTTYTQAAANTLDSYVPHLSFFTQVRWRTEQLLDHWFDLWDTLENQREQYAYFRDAKDSVTNQLVNSAENIAAAKVQIAAIDALQAKIEANRQATVQVNQAVNQFLTIVPPSATPAAITGEKLELLQQAVADFKQQIGGQDVMAYLHDFSVPLSAWQGHSNTTTKDNYTFNSLGGSAADNVANGPVRYVASLSPSVFSFEKWLNTSNPQGTAATSLSVEDTITDQFAYVTGLLTNASKTDTSLLNLGKIPSDETWTEVTQKLGTARTVARNALLQAQAQLKLDYTDIGAALSGLRKVQVPGGYDGYWYQMALALQSLQSTDLPANGVTATAAVLEYPPGSGERVSLQSLLDNLQTQADTDPQRTVLAQKLLDVLQDDPSANLGTNATLLAQAKLLDTGLISRFENTTNLSNFAGALVTAFGAGSNAISNSQISAWGVALFGADSQLAAAIALGNTTLNSTQWTAAARELRLIQEDLERGYAGALNGQTQTVKEAATRAVLLSEALTTLNAATTFSGYATSLTTLGGGSRPFALSTATIKQWATQLFGSGSALSVAITATGTLTSAQWKAANAELSLIQKDIAKGEGGVLYGNKQAKLAALVNEASQGGDPLAVLTNGVFSLRDLQVDGSKTIKNTLANADNLSRLEGFLQGTLLGDAQRLSVAQQVQAVLTPDAATDGLDAALTLKLQSALASLRSTFNAHDWSTTSTKNMFASLSALFTTNELDRLRADAVGLRADSLARYQYADYRSRLERIVDAAQGAQKSDWMLALSELDWLLTARTFKAADNLLDHLDKPAGVDDWLLATTQGQVSDADLNVDAFAKGADSSDLMVKLWVDAKTQYDSMSATDTRYFAADPLYANINYGLDTDLQWSPNRLSKYRISFNELSELGTTYAGPESMLAYAVSKDNLPIQGYHWGPVLTKAQMGEVLKELEGILVGGLRQKQVNASLTRALADVVSNTRLPDAPVSLASVFSGVVDMNTLDWAKRQTLLSAIRQALPSVNAALQSWAEPEPDNAGQRMALTVAQRIQAWKAAYEEKASLTFLATATSVELRDGLTQGADIYVDRHGTYYIDGMRTRAMDVAVMTRAVAHTSFAAEYKELMDAMSERNAMIAAANSYVNNVNTVTATATATSSTPLAYAAYQLLQYFDSTEWTNLGSSTDWTGAIPAKQTALSTKLTSLQTASGSSDLIYDITAGRFSMATFGSTLWNADNLNLVKSCLTPYIKIQNLLEPLRKQSDNVTSGDILSDMTGGTYTFKSENVALMKSAERFWQFLDANGDYHGTSGNFSYLISEESTRNGGIDIISTLTGGAYTPSTWSSNWGATQRANIKAKVGDFITKTPGRTPYFEDEIDKLTNLLNTLISNKVRDNDLDQGKLQSITSQIQINTEAMTALIKAFSELNSALAQALK